MTRCSGVANGRCGKVFEGGLGGGPWSKILPELVDVASDGKQVIQNARRLWAGLVKALDT